MKQYSQSIHRDCYAQPLNLLLDSDESHAGYGQVAAHVEHCPQCQSRLEQLAADGDQWEMVGQLLSDCDVAASGVEDGGDQRSTDGSTRNTQTLPGVARTEPSNEQRLHTHLRSVLAGSSHPEMLGRLGRYDIESIIGSGGMGIVLRGFDTELHRPVAVKILASHLAHSGPARQRFARESRAAAAVVHEHVVAIHDVQTDGETPYLVMQYVAGESLQARVERLGPLSAKEILRIAMQAAAGLHAAHVQGVVHRDVKPANILLEPGVERALVTDFGLARTVDDASLTQTGVVAGSPHYMSPEQALGHATDGRTDIFSLGTVMYFMATGHPPFRAERAMGVLNRICHEHHRPLWEANPELPDELCEIVDRCLEKKAARRFANAQELCDALSQTLARMQQRPLKSRSRWWRRLRRRPWSVPAIIATPVIIAGLVAGIGWGNAWWQPASPADSQQDTASTSSGTASVRIESAPQLQSYSTEVWLQASSQERAIWNQQIDLLQQSLSTAEAAATTPMLVPLSPTLTDAEWSGELLELQQSLEHVD